MLSALLLVFLFSSVLGDPFSCQNDAFALDADNPTFYLNSTRIADNQFCLWNFTIPSNYMAEVSINSSTMSYVDRVQVYSQWGSDNTQSIVLQGNSYNTTIDGSLHVMWPPTFFGISITTEHNSTMTLSITIALKPLSVADKVPTQNLTSAVNQQPNYVQFGDWNEDTVITAHSQNNGKLSITMVSPSYSNSYANVFVYDGSGENLQFRGTLQSLVYGAGDNFYISTTDTLTFYRAMDDGITATLVINDYENMKNVTYFAIDWSPYNRADINYQQSYLIDATKGLAILTVLNDADGSNAIYLQKIDYTTCYRPRQCPNYTSPVKLLSGGMIRDYDTEGTLLGSYRDWEDFDDHNYPQYLPGMARTFVLEEGMAIVSYTPVAANTRDMDALNGRNGFVMSNNYPFRNMDQNSKDFVLSSVDGNVFTFEYTIQQQNPNEGAHLNFSTETDNYVVDLHNVTAPATFNITGLKMTMSIYGGINPSTGTYIPYKVFSTANFSANTTTNPATTTTPTPGDGTTTPSAAPQNTTTSAVTTAMPTAGGTGTTTTAVNPVTTFQSSSISTQQPVGTTTAGTTIATMTTVNIPDETTLSTTTSPPTATTTATMTTVNIPDGTTLSTTTSPPTATTTATMTTTPKAASKYLGLPVVIAPLIFRLL